MCNKYSNIDMLMYQTAKCSLTFYRRYSFTPDKFRNFCICFFFVRRTAFIYTYFSKKCLCVKLGNFPSTKCKLSFFVQYMNTRKMKRHRNSDTKPEEHWSCKRSPDILTLVKHKTYKTWKIYGKEMTLTFNTHIPS